jgi:hypothetical protein
VGYGGCIFVAITSGDVAGFKKWYMKKKEMSFSRAIDYVMAYNGDDLPKLKAAVDKYVASPLYKPGRVEVVCTLGRLVFGADDPAIARVIKERLRSDGDSEKNALAYMGLLVGLIAYGHLIGRYNKTAVDLLNAFDGADSKWAKQEGFMYCDEGTFFAILLMLIREVLKDSGEMEMEQPSDQLTAGRDAMLTLQMYMPVIYMGVVVYTNMLNYGKDMDDARLDKLLHAVEDSLFTLEELGEPCQDNEDKEEGDAR